AREMTVSYTGILPDLFKEGKGAVAQGRLDERGEFVASEVLAKHDENYMPPEGPARGRRGAWKGKEMSAELGHLALILALLVALVQGVLPIVGAQRGHAAWIAIARPAAQTQFALVAFAFACLSYAFLHNDFSVLYV